MPRVAIVFGLIVLAIAPSSSVLADEISPTEFERVFRRIDATDEQVKSIDLEGTFGILEDIEFAFSLRFRQPSRWMLQIRDAIDDMPIVWLKDRQMLLYAVNESVVYHSPDNSRFAFRLAHDGVDDAAFQAELGLLRKPSEFLFDPNFVRLNSQSVDSKHLRDQSYELNFHSKREKNIGIAMIDLNKSFPLQTLDLKRSDRIHSVLRLKSIRINEHIPDSKFTFPNVDSIREVLTVKNVGVGSSVADATTMFSKVAKSAFCRRGLRDPQFRPNIESAITADWEAIQSIDRLVGAILRADIPR